MIRLSASTSISKKRRSNRRFDVSHRLSNQPFDHIDKARERNWFRYIGIGARRSSPVLIGFSCVGRDGHDRCTTQRIVGTHRHDKFDSGHMRHLNVHDDKVGRKRMSDLQRVTTIAHPFHDAVMRAQQITKEPEIEFVVLDNEHFPCHARSTSTPDVLVTLMAIRETNPADDPAEAWALQALAWILSEDSRAERFVALTGISPDDLRARAGDPAVLDAALGFLEAHEPDLFACAKYLEIAPIELVGARMRLAR